MGKEVPLLTPAPPVRNTGEGAVAAYATDLVLSNGEAKNPKRKLVIIIVGGAMPGIGSGGELVEAEKQGVTSVADVLAGDSGGGYATAFGATGEAAKGIGAYFRLAQDKSFRLIRLVPSVIAPNLVTPVVNLDALDKLIGPDGLYPLDTAKLMAPGTVRALCSGVDINTGEVVTFDLNEKQPEEMLRRKLKGGATLPQIAGPAIEIDGRKIVDGGAVHTPIAIKLGEDEGATDYLILHNGQMPDESEGIVRVGAKIARRQGRKELADELEAWGEEYRIVLDRIFERMADPTDNPTPENPNMEIIVPNFRIGMLERDQRKLRSMAQAGAEAFRGHFPTLTQYTGRRYALVA